MTKAGARAKLREILGPIQERAEQEFEVPDIQDAVRLLALIEGRSEALVMALVEEAGFKPLTPLAVVFIDEGETS